MGFSSDYLLLYIFPLWYLSSCLIYCFSLSFFPLLSPPHFSLSSLLLSLSFPPSVSLFYFLHFWRGEFCLWQHAVSEIHSQLSCSIQHGRTPSVTCLGQQVLSSRLTALLLSSKSCLVQESSFSHPSPSLYFIQQLKKHSRYTVGWCFGRVFFPAYISLGRGHLTGKEGLSLSSKAAGWSAVMDSWYLANWPS